MPTYVTKHIVNLGTGEPFSIELSQKDFDELEQLKTAVERSGGSISAVRECEFVVFPSYEEVMKIYMGNGFTTELLTQILKEYGLEDRVIEGLLANKRFIRSVKPWFEDITCDSGRAAYTMRVVYDQAARIFKAQAA